MYLLFSKQPQPTLLTRLKEDHEENSQLIEIWYSWKLREKKKSVFNDVLHSVPTSLDSGL